MDVSSELKNANLEVVDNTTEAAISGATAGRIVYNTELGVIRAHDGTEFRGVEPLSVLDTELAVNQLEWADAGDEDYTVTKSITKGAGPLIINLNGPTNTNPSSGTSTFEIGCTSTFVGRILRLNRIVKVVRDDTVLVGTFADTRLEVTDHSGGTWNRWSMCPLPSCFVDDCAAGTYEYKITFSYSFATTGADSATVTSMQRYLSTNIIFLGV